MSKNVPNMILPKTAFKFNPLSTNPTKWSNTLKHANELALKGLSWAMPYNSNHFYRNKTKQLTH